MAPVRERIQIYNPKTDAWTKRDSETGRLTDGAGDREAFRGVRREH